MNKEMVAEIAKLQAGQWTTIDTALVLTMVLTAVVCTVAAFAAPYLAKRGEIQATKDRFEEILGQLRKNTEATEQIRTEIAHQDWTAREWKATRGKKLEELLLLVSAMDRWHDELWSLTIRRDYGQPPGVDPSDHVIALQLMYFPELRDVVPPCVGLFAKVRAEIFEFRARNTRISQSDWEAGIDRVMLRMAKHFDEASIARRTLQERVVDVMVATFGDQAKPPSPAAAISADDAR
ncbi:hypothetical protein IEQ11_08185 [Lysobacter capsici]|uniref:hypothetical protein n=1 Tax=Lysobacter capsici TaxID=435897 RepID=UPI00177CE575|nr:hypothetical protein [Lysobacter capsici]UOF16610.1 hypothetical protein IEQ11_08185 [Lysobacter capsici]